MRLLFMMLSGMLFIIFSALPVYAGVITEATRVIYPGNKKEASLTVSNQGKQAEPYLIQSWVDNNGPDGLQKSSVTPPFVVTPPLFRLNAGEDNSLRIIRTGGILPEDRESLFWLNIKAIPRLPENAPAGLLQIVVKTRLKLFYRPAALLTPAGQSAWRQLQFSRQAGQLRVTNPTPFYFTFFKLKTGSSAVATGNTMVPPFGQATYPWPAGAAGNDVSWQVVNDYGGASSVEKTRLR
ncbi:MULTISPECIES: fimbrial biogenesis chaperone [Rahnella]|uniref:fimbrial biogenesis chaperone n=1 Tax=Rahnella TaxID=34037 RepID=UPI0010395372|nr:MULTISPECIES: molecular chaperone [Rahnella]TBX31869.1 molecular chaperone [Rahnella victoriana]TDS92558.1 P pilus assembly chaperone PapD [Rahnella sp. BIGb0236]VTQ53537.1 Chaperone protein focC precursor [Campylobacter jejuni]